MTEDGKKRRVLFFISAGLVAATLVAYEPIRHNGFVDYDDPRYITENPDITSGLTLQSFSRAFTYPHANMWHPLTTLSHILDCQFFGLNPLGHHIVSVSLHIANALLLFWILNSLTGSAWPSAFVAAVFALHPLQVESVAWAAERKTVLSGLFWFVTIAVYIWYVKRPGIKRYVVLFGIYGLCIMTKPAVITLPLVLLLLDYWPLERMRGRRTEDRGRKTAGRLIVEKIPLLVLSAVLAVATVIAQQGGGAIASLDVSPLSVRVANMFLSYTKYIWNMIYPDSLTVLCPYLYKNFSDAAAVSCAALFTLITIFSIYAGRRRKYAAAGWLWFVVTLVPVIGLVQAGAQAMADRYMYLSMIGLLIIVAWAIKDLIAGHPRRKYAAILASAIVLLSLVILTRIQVRYWQNSLTLWGQALKVDKNNAVAEGNYANALCVQGRLIEGEAHLRNAMRINPNYSVARSGLGDVLLKQKKVSEAIACYKDYLKLKQDSAEVYCNLAFALNIQGKYDEAIQYLAVAFKLDPDYPDIHKGMGLLLLKTGKLNEAIEHFNEALKTDASEAGIYDVLGSAYNQSGKYEQARSSWRRAAELDPNNVAVLNDMGWLLATAPDQSLQDANKAIDYARSACLLTKYKDASFLDTLAAAYATAGRFEDAVKTAKQALDIANGKGQEKLAGEIQDRIKLYEAGQPYRQGRKTEDR
jgi:tetratricopeptide (TPR) repeat protein